MRGIEFHREILLLRNASEIINRAELVRQFAVKKGEDMRSHKNEELLRSEERVGDAVTGQENQTEEDKEGVLLGFLENVLNEGMSCFRMC